MGILSIVLIFLIFGLVSSAFWDFKIIDKIKKIRVKYLLMLLICLFGFTIAVAYVFEFI